MAWPRALPFSAYQSGGFTMVSGSVLNGYVSAADEHPSGRSGRGRVAQRGPAQSANDLDVSHDL